MSNVKLIVLLVAASLLITGAVNVNQWAAIAGALLYISLEIIDLVLEYRAAKLFREGAWEPNEGKSIAETLSKWIRNLLLFSGLFLMLGGYIAGVIIWVGSIICWFVAGVIAREVAGIPVRMGYGGWKVYRPRKRRTRQRRSSGKGDG
jgi:protein-S-isoprenylcysteine O-methyltransferase Ste14